MHPVSTRVGPIRERSKRMTSPFLPLETLIRRVAVINARLSGSVQQYAAISCNLRAKPAMV